MGFSRSQRTKEIADKKRQNRERNCGFMRELVGKEVYEYRTAEYGANKGEPEGIRILPVVSVSPSLSKIKVGTYVFEPDRSMHRTKFAPLTDKRITAAYEAQEQAKRDAETAKQQAAAERTALQASGGIAEEAAKVAGVDPFSHSTRPWILMPHETSNCRFSILDANGDVVLNIDSWASSSSCRTWQEALALEGNREWLANILLMIAGANALGTDEATP